MELRQKVTSGVKKHFNGLVSQKGGKLENQFLQNLNNVSTKYTLPQTTYGVQKVLTVGHYWSSFHFCKHCSHVQLFSAPILQNPRFMKETPYRVISHTHTPLGVQKALCCSHTKLKFDEGSNGKQGPWNRALSPCLPLALVSS